MLLKKIISGGQAGVDRAALDAAIDNSIDHGGWCPRGRIAEDGIIDSKYLLTEAASRDYVVRTRWNVRDSDGTLILKTGVLEGGTALTAATAGTLNKTLLIIELEQQTAHDPVIDWIRHNQIRVLNVAGPRESKQPGIYQKAYQFLDTLFRAGKASS